VCCLALELGVQSYIESHDMETIDTMKSRRAVREYSDAPVPRETIERLAGAAILAPSAMNLQPARDEGLGTCWIGLSRPWFNLPSTKRELSLPEQYEVVAPIILGQPKAWPESHGRHPAEIHWI